jgi:polysaccharide biosynthesis protein PslH
MAKRTAWSISSDLPVWLYAYDLSRARDDFRRFRAEHYDVALFLSPICYAALGAEVRAPAILDWDDLMSVPEFRTLRPRQVSRYRPGYLARAWFQRVDVMRWARYERWLIHSNCWLLVCKEADRLHLGGERTEVVPNGYELKGPPLGRLEVASPPNILFPGRMTYFPNADAATYFLDNVFPRLREEIGDITTTIAGVVNPERRRRWGRVPGVIVTGFVPHIEDVLAKADIVAVPLRGGRGTRIKILEAFAHRIPVVSTTIGVEGLGVSSGRELLLADSPKAFGDACVQLLTDRELRRRLVDAAYTRYEREFRWPSIREGLARIARRAAEVG